MKFPKLFEPTCISSMELKNRIVMAPMITNLAGTYGEVTDQQLEYYVERAKGGVSLIDVAWACVDRWPSRKMGCLYVDSDDYVRGLEELTRAVHAEGAKIALQLSHPGRQISQEETGGTLGVSASDASCCMDGKTVQSRALTKQEVEKLIESFVSAALRAESAGFDAVEFHGASGYLIGQFLSPFTNKRNDRYGGSFSGRMEFALDIVKLTRERIGQDFPLIFRISGDEFVDGGLGIDDSVEIAKTLERAGIDAIHVTAGLLETYHLAMPPMSVPRGCFLPLAERVKKAVNIPVIAVGRINDPALAEEILQEGKADLIAMGRAFLSDPGFPNKAAAGDTEGIRKCIACNRCVMRIAQKLHVTCAINAITGAERRNRLEMARRKKRVLVVGGGPAGMEAARVASVRGHELVLFERRENLGGQLLLSVKPPHKEELRNELEFLTGQLDRLNVEVVTGREFTVDRLKEFSPDAVIVATGATPCIPRIPGVDGGNVTTAWNVLGETVQVGKEAVIVGGGIVGCETAEFVRNRCEEVTILEMLPELAIGAEAFTRYYLLDRLAKQGIRSLTRSHLIEITDTGVVFTDKDGNQQHLDADSIVLATGSVPERKLVLELRGMVPELFTVGDCVAPRLLTDAIHEGFNAARRI